MDKFFSMDRWEWKIALIVGLVLAREFVRLSSTVVRRLPGGNEERGVSEGGKFWIELFDSAAIAFGLVLFVINPFILQAFFIPSGSMENTLQVNDRVLVSRLAYHVRDPRAGEVVVFMPPPDADPQQRGENYIKRCFGAPGDVVYVKDRKYYRNGKLLNEPYAKWSGPDYSYDLKIYEGKVYTRPISRMAMFNTTPKWSEVTSAGVPLPDRPAAPHQAEIESAKPEAVPAGKFLMLGDHRDGSSDGHVWGFVPRENIVGKAFCLFWPKSHVGFMDNLSRTGNKAAPTSIAP